MRDGKRLFTAVYAPKEQSHPWPIILVRTPYSVGPYGADRYQDNLLPSPLFAKAGYIFAYQDVRGRWMSEGEFVNMRPHKPALTPGPSAEAGEGSGRGTGERALTPGPSVKKGEQALTPGPSPGAGEGRIDESTDTWDTIDWLVKNVPNNTGKVGTWGISYPGFYVAAGMIDAHPALKVASPQAPIADWFVGDDWHHNGALMLPHAFNFMANFGHPRPEPTKKRPGPRFDHETPDGYRFFLDMGPLGNADARHFKGDVAFWNEVMRHGTYDDFWKSRNLRPHLKNIRPAVMTVGGWFDAENLFGALETYKNVEAQSPGAMNVLVMGPWVHSGWNRQDGSSVGPIQFGAKTSEFFREQIELPFFEYHLKGTGAIKNPEAWVFQTGTNQWRSFDAWPPKQAEAKSLYLRAGGRLAGDGWRVAGDGGRTDLKSVPRGERAAGTAGPTSYDEYVSDPARPVPFSNKIAVGMSPEYMVEDQRFAARRPDVLVYQTEVLEQDLAIAGPIQVELHVSTSGTDSDWIVKLIDVYPDDYPDPEPKSNATEVRMGGYQQLVRGDVMRGKFRNSFEKPEPFVHNRPTVVKFTMQDVCHSFRSGHRIMVQVQSTWFPLVDRNPQTLVDIYTAKESDFRKATQRVYRSGELGSRVTVMVVR
jgi:putative CocE/NonD family hydrolase